MKAVTWLGMLACGCLAVLCQAEGVAGQSQQRPGSTSIDLRPIFAQCRLDVRPQGARGTCSVFTVARALEFALYSGQRNSRPQRLSVEFLNWASNQAIGQQRDGGFFSDLWKGFEVYGICDEPKMPYAGTFDPEARPDDHALAQARTRREAGLQLHWIKPWDPKRGLTDGQFHAVKETLQSGWPVCGGFLWPKKPQWNRNVLDMTSRDKVRDGHSVLLVGFRDDAQQTGGGIFLIQNTGKGPRHGAMTYEYVRTYMNDALWIGRVSDTSGS